jgi:hypothetical protein
VALSQFITQALSWKQSFNPTIMHRPELALKTYYITARANWNPQSHLNRFPQSACQVPTQYGRFLHPASATTDPFHALSEMFFIVGSSQSQSLNMVEPKIKLEVEQVLRANKAQPLAWP